MTGTTIEELKDRGRRRKAPPAVLRLYRRAFTEYGTLALWYRRALSSPTIAEALVVAECLRVEGNLRARRLAAEIEAACRAAV